MARPVRRPGQPGADQRPRHTNAMTDQPGALSFVLHSHIPFVREAGVWPHGEVWLFEAMAECYIPVLDCLFRLHEEHLPVHLTLSVTPVLLEQLADPLLQSHFEGYLTDQLSRAESDRQFFERSGRPNMQALAQRHTAFYRGIRRLYAGRLGGSLVGALARLEDAGVIEIATSAATHAYLPLLSRDASIRLQLETARHTHRRHFGHFPTTIWLPECAYRPAVTRRGGGQRPGLEALLEPLGLSLFFAETFMVTGGRPESVADDDVIGIYQAVQAAALPAEPKSRRARLRSSHHPYWVRGSQVAVLGRDHRTGSQVWSGAHGYPGDAFYQEFHKRHEGSGLRYWRVTGRELDLDHKQRYEPERAAARVSAHARHFVHLAAEQLQHAAEAGGGTPILVSAYDSELFGHWWREGVDWLEAVLRASASAPGIRLMTAGEAVRRHPPRRSVRVPEGSWGAGGGHAVWRNDSNAWIWPEIEAAEAALGANIRAGELASPDKPRLNQAARELMLMQASDWPFLISTGQAADYAAERFRVHRQRLYQVLGAPGAAPAEPGAIQRIFEKDNLFADLDAGWFVE